MAGVQPAVGWWWWWWGALAVCERQPPGLQQVLPVPQGRAQEPAPLRNPRSSHVVAHLSRLGCQVLVYNSV